MKLAKIQKDELKIFNKYDFTLEVSSGKPSSGTYCEITRATIKIGAIPVVLKKYKIPLF
jgi:hypothetical protein